MHAISRICDMARSLSSGVSWITDAFVTQTLREFYRECLWRGASPEDVCTALDGGKSRRYVNSAENFADCQLEIERHFRGWQRGIIAALELALIGYMTVVLLCCNCGRRRECTHDTGGGGTTVTVSVDDLRAMLERAR